MSAGACAHLRVSYRTEESSPGCVVAAWWECDSDCGKRFTPDRASPLVSDETPREATDLDAIRSAVDDLIQSEREHAEEIDSPFPAYKAALKRRRKEARNSLLNLAASHQQTIDRLTAQAADLRQRLIWIAREIDPWETGEQGNIETLTNIAHILPESVKDAARAASTPPTSDNRATRSDSPSPNTTEK